MQYNLTENLSNIPHLRQNRSYRCRETRLALQQRRDLEMEWPRYGINLVPGQILDFDKIFNRSAPRVLEIGFGDGASLLEMAKASLDRDFIGVEVYRKGIATVLGGIIKQGLTNLRVIQQDAVELIFGHIADQSLQSVQIFFADPWPKTRHHKRRLIQADFIQTLTQTIVRGGTIHCATDWKPYAEHMLKVLSENPQLKNQAKALGSHFIERPDFRPLTKYEKIAKKEGREIFDIIFERM